MESIVDLKKSSKDPETFHQRDISSWGMPNPLVVMLKEVSRSSIFLLTDDQNFWDWNVEQYLICYVNNSP